MEWHVSAGTQRYIARTGEELAAWLREGRIPWTALVYHPIDWTLGCGE